MKTLDEWLQQNKRICDEATKGPWTTGPVTLAGSVWVYAKGVPLLEPENPLHHVCRTLCRLFRLRSDSYPDYIHGESRDVKKDRFWQQKQRDAAFIADARLTLPQALAIIEAWMDVVRDWDPTSLAQMRWTAEGIINQEWPHD